jgi:hypothetical protein
MEPPTEPEENSQAENQDDPDKFMKAKEGDHEVKAAAKEDAADPETDQALEQDTIETKSLDKSENPACQHDEQAGSERIQRAYGLVNNLLRDRLEREAGDNIAILDELKASDILVVKGTYDHIHLVLRNLNIPFLNTSPAALSVQTLSPEQTIFVNCASDFPRDGALALERFVKHGGQLITTDWALKNVLEVGFPGYVCYNGRATGDQVVSVELLDKEDPVIAGFLDEEADPVWWLEGSSYPIQILNKEKVTVLVASKELEDSYGEGAVIIRFRHGEGFVYHMISHFYLQRSETRAAKQKQKSSAYAMSKGASAATVNSFMASEAAFEDMDYGLTQSAMTSAEFISRSILSQRKRSIERSKKVKDSDADKDAK